MDRRGLGGRLAGTFAALDLILKGLVGAGFVHLMGGRGELVATIATVCVPIWIAWLGFVYWSTRRVERARLPAILAIAWGVQWTGAFALVVVVDGHGFDLAIGLFLLAMLLGPPPLAHALTAWLVAPEGASPAIMTCYALGLVVAPSAYIAALGAAARLTSATAIATLVCFALFAILLAVLLANELRERLKRTDAAAVTLEAREAELGLVRRIQTSLLPTQLAIDELEIAAKMVPTEQVGGDYYDVLPGGWIAIGDVSGHGVNAGLIMLMLQSITAATVQSRPEASPRDQVIAINRVLFANIRHRLQRKDYATFTLLRYEAGAVRFAGAHEEILVWRAKTGACERIETPGPWIGAADGLDHVIVENQLALEQGDLLVLYTDGVVEAKGEAGRYGIDRLCAAIAAHARDPIGEIPSAVIASVTAWAPLPDDDMSIVVARQR
jgi:serine phosphatase RsbU (regulator of sigma subunit)